MATLQAKLTSLFRQGLKQGDAELETLSNGHVCGHVISSEFARKDFEDRRRRIHRLLDKALSDHVLSAADLPKVSTLLTYTPAEWSVAITDIQSEPRNGKKVRSR